MVAINNSKISEKVDGAEALLKHPKAENMSVPITVVSKVRAKESRLAGVSIVIFLLLCTVTLAVGIWLKSERYLPSFCCPCDTLTETPGTVRKGNATCCINTESEYVQTMKHMLNKPEPESKPEGSEDSGALISKKEMKMLEAKNETITLLHSSPVAAHVLVSCTNSSYYPYPQILVLLLKTYLHIFKNQINPRLFPFKTDSELVATECKHLFLEVQNLTPTRTLELLPRRSLSLIRGVKLNRDHLVIQTRGLYLIYSQIYFKVIQGTNWPLELKLLCHIVERYNERLPNDGIDKLLQSTHTLPTRVHPGNTMFDFHTSYISGVVELEVNDEVFVRASLEDVVSRYPTLNYLGLVKLK